MTPRIEHALDAMVGVAQQLFGLLGNTIIRHRAERVLALLWDAGYVPVKRSELEAWRSAARVATSNADATMIAGSIEHLTREWHTFHARQPEQQRRGALGANIHSRHKRNR